jgi:mRNA interferase RelE/StbE
LGKSVLDFPFSRDDPPIPTSSQEWKKLDGAIREQFKKKLAERLVRPCVESARLKGMADCYKIKLKNAGYRLVYQVDASRVVVIVVAVGKRFCRQALR